MSADVVVVAVPARDEADSVEECLRHVLVSRRLAYETRSAHRVVLAVSAHRCSDDSASRARATLVAARLVDGEDFLVVEDNESTLVGEVRCRLIDQVAARVPLTPRSWVFSTDADSTVPPDGITALLAQADRCAAVAGLVTLDRWGTSEAARRAYDALVVGGLHFGGHTHVYGANLAVRWDAYRAVGGFPHSGSEDVELVRRLRSHGYTVKASSGPVVTTSGREHGRAVGGLATLLQQLSSAHPARTRI